MSQKTDIGILGADGRMGQAVAKVLADHKSARLTAALTAPNSPLLGQAINGVTYTDNFDTALTNCDVLIDFSAPEATLRAVELVAAGETRCRAVVSGTTGLGPHDETALIKAAGTMTLLRSGNFSMGVNLLEALVEQAARALKDGWDIEVLEMHHRHKVDAPSGTAFMLGQAAARGRGVKLLDAQVLSREGQTGARTEGEIGFATLRGGGVIGAHEVRIASELEMVTLSHDAFDRSVFAEGAVSAALWAGEQKSGLYSMRDVLGL
ncbi:4-hydroxy-tetrahydrodipicolinate reductase [Litorimonas sp. RW-G-Af-16]|uniref:4-hydroxy-tetrahydrodipicolinate reductase n=1 Tax=Litorimonas sp. RW-G-Af-16 TaxID=3241168 RepID=UPI00390CC375